jgi:hypothetical protein
MASVVQFPTNPNFVTARELARRRWEAGDFRGPGIWLEQEALGRIESVMAELYNMASAEQAPGGISASVVAAKTLDALIWLAMATEISRLALAESAQRPPG